MTRTEQDFHVMRGDRFSQPFIVTLDQGRTLDGSETWLFHVRLHKTDSLTKLELASPMEITVNATTFQPTVEFFPFTLTEVSFPSTERPVSYWFDLVMIKGGSPETVTQARMVVTTDVER